MCGLMNFFTKVVRMKNFIKEFNLKWISLATMMFFLTGCDLKDLSNLFNGKVGANPAISN